ncbi:iron-containing alcohol dehydrogenase family protein [Sodalis glossinidius]|uniref:iron-containing alcohol dehydrogenase family protein n=1 Tax=Sodalis glossinidius TaxID=63612 RepID=UPI000318BB27|nr:iron-containing alcohol dehydrogenase family protein [Sodalis glossinidius]
MTTGAVSPAFQRVAEAIIAVAGMVGGCAESGRMAGAHAIHNAMSHLPETHPVRCCTA